MRIVKLNRYLADKVRERILSAQLLRSGTSIGANVCEAGYAQSKRDFVSKMSIALKEAAETEYWLELLFEGEFVTQTQFESLQADCIELIKMLTATINTTKRRIFLEEKI
ncbi:MAG: four helix bundle protein [Opitutales bacterium]|nr:four helix bundle protein [Opitutales bacterium]